MADKKHGKEVASVVKQLVRAMPDHLVTEEIGAEFSALEEALEKGDTEALEKLVSKAPPIDAILSQRRQNTT